MPTAVHASAYFLVGPTATGKTAVAQYLAERRGAEILSADSMLVYRGMDIGTAKPSREERERVRYWGLDAVAPSESYNVSRFLDEARRCFESAAAVGKSVIVVGGTGLYIKALLVGLDELPSATPESREKWQAVFQKQGVNGLRVALESLGPEWLSALPESDQTNGRRLIRALELIEAGVATPPRSWTALRSESVITGLAIERAALVGRIEARVQAMYDGGLLDEARALLEQGWDPSCTAAQAIGYAEAVACLRGQFSQGEANRLTAQRTRQLAKRQMTWFRNQSAVSWITVTASMTVEDIASRVTADWEKHGPQPVVLTS
ncbi:MAG: tRNA (adenosine(37)-N6)-dimethylallyltransferase MiaA [bacterium]